MKLTQVEITTIQLYKNQIALAQGEMQAYIKEQILGRRKLKGFDYTLNMETWELEKGKPLQGNS